MTTETSVYEYALQGVSARKNVVALRYGATEITYEELFRKIDTVAANLMISGIGQGDVITVSLPNCPEAVILFYAIAKIGAISDWNHPQIPLDLLENRMKEAKSRLLITTDSVLCRSLRCKYFLVGGNSKDDCANSFQSLYIEPEMEPDYPASNSLANKCAVYIHTSGTTGGPKTVMHSHSSLNWCAKSVYAACDYIDFSTSTTLLILPICHLAGLALVVHQYVIRKAKLIIIPKFKPSVAVDLIEKHKIDLLFGVPAIWNAIIQVPQAQTGALASLRRCNVFGDRVTQNLKQKVDRCIDPTGQRRCLLEAYSSTEMGVVGPCESDVTADRIGSCGLPQLGSRAAVLANEEVELRDAEGELLLAGKTMMMGYLHGAEDAIYVYSDGEKWLRTGDYGRIDSDGYVYVLGRLKDIIIHNGYNIVPDEIASAIVDSCGATDAVVFGEWSDERNTQTIKAYVVSEKRDPEKIKSALKKRLPPYSIPEKIIFTEVIPRNAMGKPDKAKLLGCSVSGYGKLTPSGVY